MTLQRITRESLRFQRVAVPPFRRGISVVNPMEDDASKVASLCSLLSSRRVSPNAQWARDRKYSFDSRSDVFDRVYRMKLDEQPMKLLRPMILFFFFPSSPRTVIVGGRWPTISYVKSFGKANVNAGSRYPVI